MLPVCIQYFDNISIQSLGRSDLKEKGRTMAVFGGVSWFIFSQGFAVLAGAVRLGV